MVKKPTLTIGICAYNEGKNIGLLLNQLSTGSNASEAIMEIIVVSSGSSDSTDAIVRKLASHDKRIRFIREKERLGKVSALNRILSGAKGDIIVLSGADLQLEMDTIRNLIFGFKDPKTGMIGARPIPVNDKRSFSGFCSHLVWDLHHQIARRSPKCGELVAFRNIGCRIPDGIGCDEAYIEYLFRKAGWSIEYAGNAIVHNKGPDSVSDYIKQRRRIHAQHMRLKKETGYTVATSDPALVISALVGTIFQSPRSLVFGLGAITLESLSVFLGSYDFYVAKDDHKVWEVVDSTKEVAR
jgi:biofilm PGA synthesis N-glycosyltransferase PgaC